MAIYKFTTKNSVNSAEDITSNQDDYLFFGYRIEYILGDDDSKKVATGDKFVITFEDPNVNLNNIKSISVLGKNRDGDDNYFNFFNNDKNFSADEIKLLKDNHNSPVEITYTLDSYDSIHMNWNATRTFKVLKRTFVYNVNTIKDVTPHETLTLKGNEIGVEANGDGGKTFIFASENTDGAVVGDYVKINFDDNMIITSDKTIDSSQVNWIEYSTKYGKGNNGRYFDSKIMQKILDEKIKSITFKIISEPITGTISTMEIDSMTPGKSTMLIENKFVNKLVIDGKQITELDIEGHTYSFAKDINISNDEIESFVAANTTWATTATIDTTAQLKGLDVTYSKSAGIADGEAITVTVKAPTNDDTLNGGTTDVVFSNVVIANPNRTVTQDQVDNYIKANQRIVADTISVDLTKWTVAGTKLSAPKIAGIKDKEVVTFTVTALPGYTVNGGASVDYDYTFAIEHGLEDLPDSFGKVLTDRTVINNSNIGFLWENKSKNKLVSNSGHEIYEINSNYTYTNIKSFTRPSNVETTLYIPEKDEKIFFGQSSMSVISNDYTIHNYYYGRTIYKGSSYYNKDTEEIYIFDRNKGINKFYVYDKDYKFVEERKMVFKRGSYTDVNSTMSGVNVIGYNNKLITLFMNRANKMEIWESPDDGLTWNFTKDIHDVVGNNQYSNFIRGKNSHFYLTGNKMLIGGEAYSNKFGLTLINLDDYNDIKFNDYDSIPYKTEDEDCDFVLMSDNSIYISAYNTHDLYQSAKK